MAAQPPAKPLGTTPLGNPPTPQEIDMLHFNADVDLRPEALHHTIGNQPNQAASGSHTHNGTDSPLLLDGFSITGNTTDLKVNAMIQLLVRLGAKDETGA